MSDRGLRVVVVGSANVDLVVPVERHPHSGETILGGQLSRHAGGKGANQAAAAADAGGVATGFVACLGDDEAGELLRESLTGHGVDTSLVQTGDTTGTALIWVTPQGDNTIIVAPGANHEVCIGPEEARAIESAEVVLAQLEIPMDVVLQAARCARGHAKFVLNAAPSAGLPEELWPLIDVLVVNEHEAADMAGCSGAPEQLAEKLLERVPAVVVTLGGDGLVVAQRGSDAVALPAMPVTPVDTTGAGDVFCGVLVAGLSLGEDLVGAARRASVAGALATTKHGAQTGVPSNSEVEAAFAAVEW